MADIIKLTVALTVVSITAALAIAFTNSKTANRILLQQQISQKSALEKVFPANSDITEKNSSCTGCPTKYWVARKDNSTIYGFEITSRGYSGNIQFMVSITSEGKILGMTIMEQSETPGLGARLQESITKKYFWNGFTGKKEEGLYWFTSQFKGIDINRDISIDKSVGEWHKLDDNQRARLIASNGITAITGSTISTKAVTSAIENQVRSYLKALQGN